MINRCNDSRAEWLIEKQMRAAEAHKTHWLINAQAPLERSLQNIRSPDEWEKFEAAIAGLNRRRRAAHAQAVGAPIT